DGVIGLGVWAAAGGDGPGQGTGKGDDKTVLAVGLAAITLRGDTKTNYSLIHGPVGGVRLLSCGTGLRPVQPSQVGRPVPQNQTPSTGPCMRHGDFVFVQLKDGK